MIDNPCYNKKTKTDCPRRAPGCAVNCPEWKKHTAERESIYSDRKKTMDFYQGVSDISRRRLTENRKKRANRPG